jgi:hypothetical protein
MSLHASTTVMSLGIPNGHTLHRTELDNVSLDSATHDIVALPSNIPVAELQTISLQSLKRGDTLEEARLFQACREDGFFYLDLHNVNGLLDSVQEIYRLDEDIHALPDEEKLLYDVDKLSKMKLNGYGMVAPL